MPKFNSPVNFSFVPEQWSGWKERFARYRIATELHKKDGDIQVNSLIYAMGDEAEKVYKGFKFAAEADKNDYDKVLQKFDDHFNPKKYVIHQRVCFYQRVQNAGETAEAFIRDLYSLAEKCDFGTSRDDNIRDKIVVGILDKEVSQKLQMEDKLTLEIAKNTAIYSETVKGHLSDQTQATAVDEIKRKSSGSRQNWSRRKGGDFPENKVEES